MRSIDYSHVSQVYDLVYADRTADLGYYRSVVARAAAQGVARVLEVGSGTGRVLLPLATDHPQLSFTAVDVDADELTVLRHKLDDTGLGNVEVRHGDLCDLPDGEGYGLVIAPFRVFQHCLTLDDLSAAFARVHGVLEPGGRFVFDVFNPSIPALTVEGHLVTQEFVGSDGVHVRRDVEVNRRDYFHQIQQIEEYYTVSLPDGTHHNLSWVYETRYHFRGEIEPLLRQAGLEVEAVYGDFDRRPFGQAPYPGELVFEAKRVGVTG